MELRQKIIITIDEIQAMITAKLLPQEPATLEEAKARIRTLGNSHEDAYTLGKTLAWLGDHNKLDTWIKENGFPLKAAYYFIEFAKQCDKQGFILTWHGGHFARMVRLATNHLQKGDIL